MRTTILSGSARINNHTLWVAKAIQKQIPGSTIVDFQGFDLPHANEGFLGDAPLSPFQETLVEGIDRAQLLFVLTPEYNWFPSAELVHMVHHLAGKRYSHIFNDLVVCFVGVSTGRGGRMPAVQLSYVFDKIFNVFSLDSITSPKKFESQFTTQCLDSEGNMLQNDAYNKGLADFVTYSLNVAERWHSNS